MITLMGWKKGVDRTVPIWSDLWGIFECQIGF